MINTVLLPAHAQTSIPPINPDWLLTGVTTDLLIPSGETLPVESYTRLRLSGCGLLPDTTVSVDATATISPNGEIAVITAAIVSTATGSFDDFIDLDRYLVLVTSIVESFRFTIDVDGELFNYTANADAIGAAAAGTATPASC